MTLCGPCGDQGCPDNLDTQVVCTLDDAGLLSTEFGAKTDAPAVVNLTNRVLLSLGGNGWLYGAYHHTMIHRISTPASQ